MQRKATKQSRGPNADEKAFQAWLKEQPCCISGSRDAEVHHMYGSSFKHNKIHIGHWACIPLSYDYHRGSSGYHTIGQKTWRQVYGNQSDYWDDITMKYFHETGNSVPDDVYRAVMGWGK